MKNVNNMSELEELVKWCKIRGAMLLGKSPYEAIGPISEVVKVNDQISVINCVITKDDIMRISLCNDSW